MRRLRQEQRDAGLTCNARPAAVIGQTRGCRNKWGGRRNCRTQRTERNWTGAFASVSGSVLPVAGSAREQENPGVRGEIGIANPFGSIVSSHDPRHPAVPTLVDRSTNHHHHKSPWGLPLRPFSTHYNPRQASSSTMESRHCRAHLITDSIHCGSSLSVCSSS
jgi:hypothetical protein